MNYYIILQLSWLSISLERSKLIPPDLLKMGRKNPVEQDRLVWMESLSNNVKAKKRINLPKTFQKLRALQKNTEAKTRLVIIHSMYNNLILINYQMTSKLLADGSGMEAFAFTSVGVTGLSYQNTSLHVTCRLCVEKDKQVFSFCRYHLARANVSRSPAPISSLWLEEGSTCKNVRRKSLTPSSM